MTTQFSVVIRLSIRATQSSFARRYTFFAFQPTYAWETAGAQVAAHNAVQVRSLKGTSAIVFDWELSRRTKKAETTDLGAEGSQLSLTRDEYVKQLLAIKNSHMGGWLWAVAHDLQSLEDLRQDAYERLLSLDDTKLAIITSVKGYARGVCQHVAMDWLDKRRIRRNVQYVDTCDVFYDEGQNPEAILHANERLESVSAILAHLPERQRLVLVLRKVYGLTAKEIAMEIGIKVTTVKRSLYDAALSLEKLASRDATEDTRWLLQILGARE